MMKLIVRHIGMVLAVMVGVAPLHAVDGGPTVKLNLFSIEGAFIGTSYTIDQSFAAKYSVAVPANFKFSAPKSGKFLTIAKAAPGGTGIVKIFFTTPDKDVISNIQFIPLAVDMGDEGDRMVALEKVVKDVFIKMVPSADRAEISVVQSTKVGPYSALEALGRYDGGELGVVILRVVAVLNPDSENGLLAVINAIPKHVEMQAVGDILKTRASVTLDKLQFTGG
jgi:hypothetical protein